MQQFLHYNATSGLDFLKIAFLREEVSTMCRHVPHIA